jgi:hypothetical protein
VKLCDFVSISLRCKWEMYRWEGRFEMVWEIEIGLEMEMEIG